MQPPLAAEARGARQIGSDEEKVQWPHGVRYCLQGGTRANLDRVMRKTTAGLSLFLVISCASTGPYVWVEHYPQPVSAAQGYVIAPGDMISVRVYNQEGMSAKERVRADGKISLPFLNDVEAAGYTPTALAQQLQTRLKDFVKLPVVTVALEDAKPIPVSLLGEITRPGLYQLDAGAAGLLQLLAMAGGVTEFAHSDRIFVVRQSSSPSRIRFRYQSLIHADGPATRFRLQSGDVVVVE
jgi:polysaccharide biosynthesis/export protein